ncbi:hypothetical protein TVAG_044580 [Trichomonas vaginalis G3]|uniref:Uncharacterized protein n=1 Tax=Trichomonas vaginalis (strain ATCC PRA-98 / G3) TaxID=412133 RepID=A2EY30_TRIV3|nr:hypothetical protein TVAGG3_0300730 [Trichomonas vaginalis G3]EAY02440.1 hypothetical protein TVAG_044580 [Trichomonas vaginalis G3]KAI5527865.1 hypothetical protein TVAGG3_0300730 [Trichomonas vaginalis G3]|eukprot:XP_001330680.1 hypothetical protein [Trichomonas vaginalis G3]
MTEPRVLVSNEETIGTLVEMLATSGSKDPSVFYQIRDFFFDLPQQDFDRFAKEVTLAVIKCISNNFSHIKNGQNIDFLSFSKFLQTGLSLLLYLGYKIQFSLTDNLPLDNLIAHINSFDEISLTSIVKIVIYSWQYKDHDQASIEFITSRINLFYPFVCNKLRLLAEQIETIRPAQYSTIFSLIQCLMACGKISERTRAEFLKTLKVFYETISKPVNLSNSTVYNISHLSILMKMGFSLYNTQIPEFDNNTIVNSMLNLISMISPYFASLIEDFFQSSNQVLRYEIEKQENIPRLINCTYEFKNITSDSLAYFVNFAHLLAETLIKQQKTKPMFITQFCKFTSSVIQFQQQPFRARNGNFYQLLPLVKIPSEGTLRSSLVEVFFYSLHLELMECDSAFINASDLVLNQDYESPEYKDSFTLLHQSMENINTIVKCFDSFLHITQTKNLQLSKPVTAFLDANINSFTVEMITKIFVRLCMIIIRNRKSLQMLDTNKTYSPSSDTEANIDSIAENQKNVKLWIMICNFHQDISTALINSIQSTTPVLLEYIWPNLIELFFNQEPPIQFDSCLFRAMYQSYVAFSVFMKYLQRYFSEHWNNSYQLLKLIQNIRFLFEKVFLKTKNPDKPMQNQDQEYHDSIIQSVNKICQKVKELLQNEKFAFDGLSLLLSASKYYDIGDISELCDTIAITPKSSILLVEYIISQTNKLVGRPIVPIFNCLIKTVCHCKTESLKMMHNLYKMDKKIFIRPNLDLQNFVDYIFANLDSTTGENKKLLMKFLHHIPQEKLTPKIDTKPFINNEKLIQFFIDKSTKQLTFDYDLKNLFESLYKGVEKSDSQDTFDFLKELICKMIEVDDECYTCEYKIYLLKSFSEAFNCLKKYLFELFDIKFNIKENRKPSVIAIFLLSYLTNYKTPELHLLSKIFSQISEKEKMKNFMEEISFFVLSKSLLSPFVAIDICEIIMNNVDKDMIQASTFALLVNNMISVINSNSWKESQKIDGLMNFIELDLLPKRIQKIIYFVRQMMKDQITDVYPLLQEIKTTNGFISNLVLSEMLSECQRTQEIIDFIRDFLDEAKDDDLKLFRTSGTLFRSFPQSYNQLSGKVQQIITPKLEKILEKDKKYQTTFLVLLIPILEQSNDITDITPILKIALQNLDRPTSFIKCQCQLIIRALFKNGDAKAKNEITRTASIFMKERKFPVVNTINEFMNINWKLVSSELFTFLFYNSQMFIDLMFKYLDLLPEAVKNIQDLPTMDLLENISCLYELCQTGFVNKLSSDTRQFKKLGKALLKLLAEIPILQFPRNISAMSNFLISNIVGFKDILKDCLKSDSLLEVLVKLADNKAFIDMASSFLLENMDSILEILNEKEKNDRRQIFLVLLLMKLPLISENENVIEKFFEIYESNCSFINTKIELFDGPFLLKLSEYLAKHFTEKYLSINHIFTYSEPILSSTYLHALENAADFSMFKGDFLKFTKPTDNLIVNRNLYELISMTILQRRKDLVPDFIEYTSSEFELKYSLPLFNVLIKLKFNIDYEQFDFLEIYDQCQNDDEKIELLLFWSSSKSEKDFVVLFRNLMDYLHVHPDSRVKNAISNLIIPNSVNQNSISSILLDNFLKYLRCHSIQSILLNLVSRNADYFEHPTLTFLLPVQEKIKVIESNIKTHENSNRKHTLLSFISTLTDIINMIKPKGLNEKTLQSLQMHLNNIGNALFKIITETIDVTFKYRNEFSEFLSFIGKFVSLFPTSSLPVKVFEQFTFYSNKSKENPQQKSKTLSVVMEILYSNMKDIVSGVVQNTEYAQLDLAIEIFIETLKSKDQILWPQAVQCLSKILKSFRWHDKVFEKVKPLFSTDSFGHCFTLYFGYNKPHIHKIMPAVENGLSIIKSYMNDLATNGSIVYSISYLILSLNHRVVLQYLSSILANASDTKDYKISGFLMEFILLHIPKEMSLRKKFIDLLKNTSLSQALFDRGKLPDHIVQELPLESLIVLSNHRNVTDKCLELLKSVNFEQLLLTCAKMSIPGPAFSVILSKIMKKDLISISPFINRNYELPRKSLQIMKSDKSFDFTLQFGINTLFDSEKSEVDLRILSDFPNLNDLQNNLPNLIILSKIGYSNYMLHEIDDKMNNERGREIIDNLKIGDRYILSLISQETQIEQKLSGIFNHTDCLKENATVKGLSEYMIVHEIKRIVEALKKHSNGFVAFKFKLNSYISPHLHKYYKDVRDLTCQKFTVNDAEKIDMKHMKSLNKSITLHEKVTIDLPKLSELPNLVKNQQSLSTVFIVTKMSKLSPETVDKAAAALIKSKPESILPYLLFLDDKSDKSEPIKKILSGTPIPYEISLMMAEIIQQNENLQNLKPLIHNSFNFVFNISENYQKDAFLSSVFRVCNSLICQSQLQALQFAETEIEKIKGTKEEKSNESPALDSIESQPIMSQLIEGKTIPMVKTNDLSYSLSLFVEKDDDCDIKIRITTSSGNNVYYSLSPYKYMSLRLSYFTKFINRIFSKMPGTNNSGILLNSIDSVDLKNGFYLSLTSLSPLFNYSDLISMNEEKTTETNKKQFTKITKESHAFWFNTVGSRYAALFVNQILIGGGIPSPLNLFVDGEDSKFAISDVEYSEIKLPRLVGRIKQYFDDIVLRGPFRNSILCASDAICRNREKVLFFIEEIFNEERDVSATRISELSKFSPLEMKQPNEALDEAGKVISAAVNINDKTVIPWI